MCQYREMLFGEDAEELQIRRIGEILGLSRVIDRLPEDEAELEVRVEKRVPPQDTMPDAREALKMQVFRTVRSSFFARQIPLVFYSSLGWGGVYEDTGNRAPPKTAPGEEAVN